MGDYDPAARLIGGIGETDASPARVSPPRPQGGGPRPMNRRIAPNEERNSQPPMGDDRANSSESSDPADARAEVAPRAVELARGVEQAISWETGGPARRQLTRWRSTTASAVVFSD